MEIWKSPSRLTSNFCRSIVWRRTFHWKSQHFKKSHHFFLCFISSWHWRLLWYIGQCLYFMILTRQSALTFTPNLESKEITKFLSFHYKPNRTIKNHRELTTLAMLAGKDLLSAVPPALVVAAAVEATAAAVTVIVTATATVIVIVVAVSVAVTAGAPARSHLPKLDTSPWNPIASSPENQMPRFAPLKSRKDL